MLGHVIDTARQLSPRKIHVVIGHGAELVRERLHEAILRGALVIDTKGVWR